MEAACNLLGTYMTTLTCSKAATEEKGLLVAIVNSDFNRFATKSLLPCLLVCLFVWVCLGLFVYFFSLFHCLSFFFFFFLSLFFLILPISLSEVCGSTGVSHSGLAHCQTTVDVGKILNQKIVCFL